MTLLTVTIMGALGVAVRYLADTWIKHPAFPLSTFLVNIIGCFIAGYIFTQPSVALAEKPALLVGFCGGLTTFSAMSLQTLQFFTSGEILKGALYLFATQFAGLISVYCGILLAR